MLEAAERYHYRPNPSARRLATGRAGAVGAVLPTDRNLLVDPHFVEFLAGLGERLVEDEMDIVLCPARGGDEAGTYRRIVAGNRVDALILSGPLVEDERVALLTELGLPFVVHGRTDEPDALCLARHRQRGRLPPRHQPPARSRPPAHRAHQRQHALHLRGASRARLPRGASPSAG